MSEHLKKAFVLLVVLAPPGGALAALWPKVEAHPYRAAALTVAYWVGVLVVGLLAKVWKDELERDVVRALATWLREGFLHFVSPFRREYLQRIVYDHRTFNVRGLRTTGAHALELDEVFVELRIASSAMQDESAHLLSRRDLPEAGPIWDFLRAIVKKKGMALTIVGPPGSGKTTLLQNVALVFARNRQKKFKLTARMPIVLFLRDHVNSIVQDEPPTVAALAEAKAQKKMKLHPPTGFFEKLLRTGRAIVLLDGLDEVANEKHRKKVSEWVDAQISTYSEVLFLLTSRPKGYQLAPLAKTSVLEVLPFAPEQVRKFIGSWYLANEITKRGGKDDLGVRQQADEQAQDLLKRLRTHRAFGALSPNPLLLTMIAMVHNYRGVLPGRRVELYAEICDVLLGHWQGAKDLEMAHDASQLRVALQPLAAHLMERGIRKIGTKDAIAVMKAPLAEIGVIDDKANGFLALVRDRGGLMLEVEEGEWSFAHLSFQEYLAAAHYKELVAWPLALKEIVGKSFWSETLRLYSAQTDASPVLEACLAEGSVQALLLASECLDEAKKVAQHKLRERVNEMIEEGLESDEPKRFRLAAEVRLERRLGSLCRIDDEREIDAGYVSCAEYQLFLDDERRKGKWRQPYFWTSERFGKGNARNPILGVWRDDARTFVQWLNTRGGALLYRLPKKVEITDHAVEPKGCGTWCLEKWELECAGIDSGPIREMFRKSSDGSFIKMPRPEEIDAMFFDENCLTIGLHVALAININLNDSLALDIEEIVDTERSILDDYLFAREFDRALDALPYANFVVAFPDAVSRHFARDTRGSFLAADVDKVRNFNFDDAASFARIFALAVALGFETDRVAHKEAFDMACARVSARALTVARARNKTYVATDVDHAVKRAVEATSMCALDKTIGRNVIRHIARELARIFAFDRNLADSDFTRIRKIARRYVTHLLELTLSRLSNDDGKFRQPIILANAWMRIAQAQEEGTLPAWGGIRIVRDETLKDKPLEQ